LEVDDKAHPSIQIHGRNKKNSSNREVKNRAKMHLKIMKMENIVENWAKNASKNHEN
jgi:hypothetical protein